MVANLKLESSDEGTLPVEGSKYLSVLGSLLYLAIGTRPDLAFAVNFLARFSSRPNSDHWLAIKHLLRYVSGTKTEGILFQDQSDDTPLITYCDANWGGGVLTLNTRIHCNAVWEPNFMGISTSRMCGDINLPCRVYGTRCGGTRIHLDSESFD